MNYSFELNILLRNNRYLFVKSVNKLLIYIFDKEFMFLLVFNNSIYINLIDIKYILIFEILSKIVFLNKNNNLINLNFSLLIIN